MTLTELIKEAKNIVAFTGAGLSTESGIPDFRSSSGLYLSGKFEGYTPEQILSNKFFRVNKPVFFDFYRQRIMNMVDKQPNRAHLALKKLEDLGKLTCVINQNIDNLLQKVGIKCVLDLHGNISQFRCISCCKTYDYTQFMAMTGIPKCDCGGIVRPNTVLFDEWLNDDAYDNAYCAAKKCDLMIVLGSSCVVRPACMLIGEIGDTAHLVILNNTKTQFDKRADIVINDKPLGEVLEETVNQL
jgi:NAD-dependent deacetylase